MSSQCSGKKRLALSGSVILVLCHCQPPRLAILKLCSIHATGTRCRREKVCENKPSFLLSFFPKSKQCAGNSFPFALKGYSCSLPTGSGLLSKVFDRFESTIAFWAKRSIYIDTHEWMPFQFFDASEQFRRIKSYVCHDDDKEISWETSCDQSQHTQPLKSQEYLPYFIKNCYDSLEIALFKLSALRKWYSLSENVYTSNILWNRSSATGHKSSGYWLPLPS